MILMMMFYIYNSDNEKLYDEFALLIDENYINWEKIFKNCSLFNKENELPTLLKIIENDYFKNYFFTVPVGLNLEIFIKKKQELSIALKSDININLLKYQLVISVIKTNEFNKKINYEKLNSLKFPIGFYNNITDISILYNDFDINYHTLITGVTGSGKSSFLMSLITYVILSSYKLVILDLKGSGDYNIFKKYRNLLYFEKIKDKSIAVLKDILNCMNERLKMLDVADCKNYKDYNKINKNKLDPVFIIIDEFVVISKDKEIKELLNVLLSQSRAVNFKFIITIQRSSAENLDSDLKANINTFITFYVNSKVNSEVVLGKSDYRAFEDLKNIGDAIYKTSKQDIQFKSLYLEDKEIKHLIYKFNKM